MNWQTYQVTLKMQSPLHSGLRKTGNIQQTRPYVTARTLWGAMTARITRLLGQSNYSVIGKMVSDNLRFSYFFPAVQNGDILFVPNTTQESPHQFMGMDMKRQSIATVSSHTVERILLSSYNSTAINPSYASAEVGSLHETEFISHRVLNDFSLKTVEIKDAVAAGEPVYLVGYVWLAKNSEDIIQQTWLKALHQLQIGGERTYGYGRTIPLTEPQETNQLFCQDLDRTRQDPIVLVRPNSKYPLLAHVQHTEHTNIIGQLEPFMGRKTSPAGKFGVELSKTDICWTPGCHYHGTEPLALRIIGETGIWEVVSLK